MLSKSKERTFSGSLLNQQTILLGLSLLLATASALPSLAAYLKPGLNLSLVLLAAPFVLQIRESGQYSHRYLVLALLFFAAFLLAHMRIFYLLGWGASLLYFFESQKGKMGFLPFILLLLLSPVPAYLAEVFTFPIRLWMSEQIAGILAFLRFDISYQGNLFFVNGNSFSIDPVCMGLNSLVSGLIVFLLLIAFAEKKFKKYVHILQISLLLGIGSCFLILSNFMRMICLVLFQSPPETASHDMIGMISLLLYGILPMYVLTEKYVAAFGRKIERESSNKTPSNLAYLGAFSLITLITLSGFFRKEISSKSFDKSYRVIELPDMEKSLLDEGINKYENEEALVYIKAPSRFWGSDHSPTICWRASGYSFDRVQVEEVNGQQLYVGLLKQGENLLHTAWWYDNGSYQTHSQIAWRLKRLEGEAPFLLINVTTTSKEKTLAYAEDLLNTSFLE
ncbi:MAG: exosortase N [Bacteroidota bacterium]